MEYIIEILKWFLSHALDILFPYHYSCITKQEKISLQISAKTTEAYFAAWLASSVSIAPAAAAEKAAAPFTCSDAEAAPWALLEAQVVAQLLGTSEVSFWLWPLLKSLHARSTEACVKLASEDRGLVGFGPRSEFCNLQSFTYEVL